MFFMTVSCYFVLECELVYLVYPVNKLIAVFDDDYVVFIACEPYAFIFFLGI